MPRSLIFTKCAGLITTYPEQCVECEEDKLDAGVSGEAALAVTLAHAEASTQAHT